MGNPIPANMKIGAIGELLVQLQLLKFDVQAAPPIKDSGNDLIAIKGEVFRGIQVKTTAGHRSSYRKLPEHYHILALVKLCGGPNFSWDQSEIFLIPRKAIDDNFGRMPKNKAPYKICEDHVHSLFS